MHALNGIIARTIVLSNYRGDGCCRLLWVMTVRDTHDDLIKIRTYQDHPITRGRYLVTAIDLDREDTIRSYYINHADFWEVGLCGRVWHRIMVAVGRRSTVQR